MIEHDWARASEAQKEPLTRRGQEARGRRLRATLRTDVLARTNGNIRQAARLAGMDRANLRRILNRLGMATTQLKDE
ncbi:MAG: hypothetical protein H0T46_02350 [Deltaproteobacteria bacterium]|nr:hypothetical protein [Deltaproteobacteria bacterium]